jgi:hypothetical protein
MIRVYFDSRQTALFMRSQGMGDFSTIPGFRLMSQLAELFGDSAWKLAQSRPEQIAVLKNAVTTRESGNETTFHVDCLVRKNPSSSRRKKPSCAPSWRDWNCPIGRTRAPGIKRRETGENE